MLRVALTEGGKNGSDHTAFIGNSWKPEAFLKACLDKEHPIDSHGALDPEYYQLLFDILTRPKAATVNIRSAKLLEASKLVSKFKDAEEKLHEAIDPLHQKTLLGKNFLVCKELCHAAGLRDEKLHLGMMSGFPIVGPMDITNEFKLRATGKQVVPTLAMAQLATTSKWSRHVLKGSVRSSGDAEVDQTVHEVTLQERDKGWLTGPHSYAEPDSIYGPLWLASRRFGVIQGTKTDGSGKIRPCDDFSEFLINATTGTTEKIEPGGIE